MLASFASLAIIMISSPLTVIQPVHAVNDNIFNTFNTTAEALGAGGNFDSSRMFANLYLLPDTVNAVQTGLRNFSTVANGTYEVEYIYNNPVSGLGALSVSNFRILSTTIGTVTGTNQDRITGVVLNNADVFLNPTVDLNDTDIFLGLSGSNAAVTAGFVGTFPTLTQSTTNGTQTFTGTTIFDAPRGSTYTTTFTYQGQPLTNSNFTYNPTSLSGGASRNDDNSISFNPTAEQNFINVKFEPKPTVSVSATTSTPTEAAGTQTVTVQLTNPSAELISVPFVVSGTASNPADFTSTLSPLAFTPGQTSKTITINVVDDTLDENNETVIVTLSAPTNATLSTTSFVHTATITDNDAAPTMQFTATASNAAESTTPANLQVSLNTASGLDATGVFTVAAGSTAANPADYAVVTTSPFTIAAGATTTNLSFTIAEDLLDEAPETIIVTLSAPTNSTLGANTTHTYTIDDNDPTPTVQFAATSTMNAENIAAANVAVNLSAASGQDVTVVLTTTAVTAATPADFAVSTTTPITIPAGQTTVNVALTVVDDIIDEADETFTLTLSAPTNATLAANTVHTYTIQDNDVTPVIQFTNATTTLAENVGTANIPVSIPAISGQDVTVQYNVAAGTATGAGTDFLLANGTATIVAGQTSVNIQPIISDDVLDEDLENFTITLSAPVNGTLGANTVNTVSITDNDATPTVSFNVPASSGGENISPALIQVSLSAVSGRQVQVQFLPTLGGTADTPADFSITTGTPLTFAPGTTTQNISLTVVDDAIAEPAETVLININTPTNATLGANPNHTYTISDNDSAGLAVQFASTTAIADESAGTINAQVTLTNPSSNPVTVDFTVTGGTASVGAANDFVINTPSPLTIAAGQTTANITIQLTDDTLNELNETIELTLSNPTRAPLGVNQVHTLTITDNDALPTVQFGAATSSAAENVAGGTATIPVNLSTASGKTVTVQFNVTGGTATAGGTDFTLAPGTVTFNPGDTTQNVTITLINDAIVDPNETVIISLLNPTESTLGATNPHTFTINDDENAPNVQFTLTNSTGAESSTPANLQLTLSAVSASNVTVEFSAQAASTATNPADFSFGAVSPITIPAGQTTVNIPLNIVNDTTDEVDETVVVLLANPAGGAVLGANTTHTYTITDDDAAPTVGFTTVTSNADEATTAVTVAVSLSATSGKTVTVNFADATTGTATAAGTDFTLTNGLLTFAPGTTSQNVTFTVVNDTLDEANETVIINLGTPSNATLGANTTHTYTINDNDAAPTVQFTTTTSNGLESVSPVNIQAQLSVVSGQDVTVTIVATGTAATPADFAMTVPLAPATSITIPAGQTTGNASFTVVDDALTENPDETVILTMSAPVNATLAANTAHTYTINDNDGPVTVQFATNASSVAENVAGGAHSITVSLSSAVGSNVTVNFAATGTAANPADYTVTSPVASTVTIPAGQTSVNIALALVNDALIEGDETAIFTLSAPTGGVTLGATTVHTATITDDDTVPTVQFVAKTSQASEGIPTEVITVQLSATSTQVVTVNFSTGGTATEGVVPADYTTTPDGPKTVSIAAGSLTGTITLNINDDAIIEVPNETVILTLAGPTNATLGANTVHTHTIQDNENPPPAFTVTNDNAAGANLGVSPVAFTVEENTAISFTVNALDPDNQATTLSLTTDGAVTGTLSTFTLNTPAAVPANQTGTFTYLPDNGEIGARQFIFTADDGAGGINTYTINITVTALTANNPNINFTQTVGGAAVSNPISSLSGNALNFTITGTDPNAGDKVTLTLQTNPTPATNLAVYTAPGAPANPAAGTLTWVPTAANVQAAPYKFIFRAAAGGATVDVTLNVFITTNPVAPAIVTSAPNPATTTEAGGTSTFTVALKTLPAADVTLTLSSSDITEGTVMPASLTFTAANGTTAQTVTVTGVDDAAIDGNVAYNITLSAPTSTDPNYNVLPASKVNLINTDNEAPAVLNNLSSGGGGGGGGSGRSSVSRPKINFSSVGGILPQEIQAAVGTPIAITLDVRSGGYNTVEISLKENPSLGKKTEATFSVEANDTKHAIGTFMWTPSKDSLGLNEFIFKAKIGPAISQKVLKIRVTESTTSTALINKLTQKTDEKEEVVKEEVVKEEGSCEFNDNTTTSVRVLCELGLIKAANNDKDYFGNDKGQQYKGNQTINRAEFTKMMILLTKEESEIERVARVLITSNIFPFIDVEPIAWFASYISLAKSMNAVNGYADGSYRPWDPIELSEAFKIVVEASTSNEKIKADLDNSNNEAGEGAAWFAAYNKVINNYGGFKTAEGIDPGLTLSKKMTRQQAADIIYSVIRNAGIQPQNRISQLQEYVRAQKLL